MPKNHYERWTQKEIDEVVELSANGMTYADIARIFERSPSSITNVLHRERRKNAGKIIFAQIDEVPSILDRIKRWMGIA